STNKDESIRNYITLKIRIHSFITLLCAAMASVVIIGSPAQAGYIVTLTQVGPNVVANGSGAIDCTGLVPSSASSGAEIWPNSAIIVTGPTALQNVDVYFLPNGPSQPFGSGSLTLASSGSGDLVGMDTHGTV